MTNQTHIHRQIADHIKYGKGTKTVCVSTCLSYLGIDANQYTYTSSSTNCTAYENVLRRFGYAVRSRISEFKVKKYSTTMTALKQAIRKSNYTESDLFLVSGVQMKSAHLMILNGLGEMVIDTAPKMKWKIKSVRQVFKN
jgi:hypothetical protein